MTGSREKEKTYSGFEQGPIRPPSEANSLLIRITRNCPWNRCTFYPVYKGATFSLRPVDHVIQDIDGISRHVNALRKMGDGNGRISREDLNNYNAKLDASERQTFHAAVNWFACGMQSVFLQDANSLVIKPDQLIRILRHLRSRFPWSSPRRSCLRRRLAMPWGRQPPPPRPLRAVRPMRRSVSAPYRRAGAVSEKIYFRHEDSGAAV